MLSGLLALAMIQGVVTTGQEIKPAGVQSVFDGKVWGVAFGSNPDELLVLSYGRQKAQIHHIHRKTHAASGALTLEAHPGLQGLARDPVSGRVFLSGARLMEITGAGATALSDRLEGRNAGPPAIARANDARGRRLIALPLIHANKLALFDLNTNKPAGSVSVPVAPFAAAIAEGGSYAYVSNWGGRVPKDGDLTAPTGLSPEADRVVIDERGVLASGTVTRVNLETMRVEKVLEAGLHPTALALAGNRLFVANTNDDTILVIDTRTDKPAATWPLQPFDRPAVGISPTALLVSPDGGTLYVACGGINAVMLLETSTGRMLGMIPTAWYPNALALSPDGRSLAVATLLGIGSGEEDEDKPGRRYVHANRGTVHLVPVPDQAHLARYTAEVARNNRLPLGTNAAPVTPAVETQPRAIPLRPGDPSLIEHVVYIVKENRTYDQLFGDLGKGNGDPSLVMFGEGVTDNQRKLARDFVLLDNFYASGGDSGDGHQWVTQANETSYTLWPAYQGRSYPFDGTDPIAYSSAGFIWDAAMRRGKSVAVYGEFAPRQSVPPTMRRALLEQWRDGKDFYGAWTTVPNMPNLRKVFSPNYPSYSTAIPDVIRASIFLKDLRDWSAKGSMPNLVILQLPSDHTYGTDPGVSTPKAMVADNDLALGMIVEGISRSPFWRKSAIFVVEDDAQDGVDHVDGHRTVALAISPFSRRRAVDSTFYAHQSILKTIELILGLEPMTLFDRIANDMRKSFSDKPDLEPYTAVRPRQDLFERNPDAKALTGRAREAALESHRMRWDVPDAVPSGKLNRILWHSTRGWDTPFPTAAGKSK